MQFNELTIRPLTEADIEPIIKYWFESDEEFLTSMGLDLTKLGSSEKFIEFLKKVCSTPIAETKIYYLIWQVGGEPIGYSCLRDITHNEIAHMHLHIWNRGNRQRGYGAKLFALSVIEFYRLFNLKMILCEPLVSNPSPNNLLKKIGFNLWRTYRCASSEISLVGEVNSYIVDPETAARFLEI